MAPQTSPMEQTSPVDLEGIEEVMQRANASPQDVSFLDLALLLVDGRRVIGGAALGLGLVAGVILFLMPNVYTATTTILPPESTKSSALAMMSQMSPLASLAGGGAKSTLDQYASFLEGDSICLALNNRFDLVQHYKTKYKVEACKALAGASKIKPVTKANVISISVVDKDPKFAAALANGYVTELKNLDSRMAVNEAGQRRQFFEGQLEKSKNDLIDAEIELKKTQEKTGMLEMSSQARAIIESVTQLRAQIATQEVMLEGMRSYATENNPDYMLAKQQLTGLQQQLAKMTHSGGGPGQSDVGIPVANVPEAGLEYLRAYREARYRETIFEALAKQFETAKLDEARMGGVIQVVDEATVPETKSGPKRTLLTLGAVVVGAILGVFYLIARSTFRRAKQDPYAASRVASIKRSFRRKTT